MLQTRSLNVEICVTVRIAVFFVEDRLKKLQKELEVVITALFLSICVHTGMLNKGVWIT